MRGGCERIERATFTNDESPFWQHVKSNKCFREREQRLLSSSYIYLSIVCVMFCRVALAAVTRCSKINEIPEAEAHLTCGIRLSNQTNHSAHYGEIEQWCVATNCNIETLVVETHNTAQCVFFASKLRLFVCFDLVSVRIFAVDT